MDTMVSLKKCIIMLAIGLLAYSINALAYSDVIDTDPYAEAIGFITEQGIVRGYDDGTYRSNSKINRAEFTKIVVGAAFGYDSSQDPSGYDIYAPVGLIFSDIESGAWYIPYLRVAVENGVIEGYPDGTFKPADNINLVEAAKILVNALNVSNNPPKGSEWYSQFIEAMADNHYLPPSFGYFGQEVTRGEMAEMVWRILEERSDEPSTTVEQLQNPCYPLGENIPSTIDMDRGRATWLGWYNDVRVAAGLHSYTNNDQLARTAFVWSENAEQRGYMDHRRDPGDVYYDYWKITDWFKNLGLEFKNVYRVTHSENISWGVYNCGAQQADCTDQLIDAIRPTFDLYMSEKDKAYKPHYSSVMNQYFNEIGLGLAVEASSNKFYLTVHYGTEITSDPWPICD